MVILSNIMMPSYTHCLHVYLTAYYINMSLLRRHPETCKPVEEWWLMYIDI